VRAFLRRSRVSVNARIAPRSRPRERPNERRTKARPASARAFEPRDLPPWSSLAVHPDAERPAVVEGCADPAADELEARALQTCRREAVIGTDAGRLAVRVYCLRSLGRSRGLERGAILAFTDTRERRRKARTASGRLACH